MDDPLPSRRFRALWAALGARGDGRAELERVRAAYAAPDRAYHDASHVSACLRLLDDPDVGALAEHLSEVEAALWFHDVVYDTRAADNEERSADLFTTLAAADGIAPDVIARIASHVRATKDHVATSTDATLVVDVDLSILGAPAHVFAQFERAIRREYAWVDHDAYVKGRAQVLRRFTERPRLFQTPLMYERYEARARENLAGALRDLGAG